MKKLEKSDVIIMTGEKESSTEIAGFWSRMLESERLARLIACLFLCTGLSLALFSMIGLESSFFISFALALACIIVIASAALRWWVPVAGFAFIFIAFTIFYLFQDIYSAINAAVPISEYIAANGFSALGQWFDFIAGFFYWIFEGAQYNGTYSEGYPYNLLQFIIILPVSAVLYMIIKRPVFFPGLIGLTAGFMIFSFIMVPADMSAAICASSAGLIVLLPGFYAKVVEKSSETDGKIRARMQLIAVPCAVLSVLLAIMVTPEDTREWRSGTLNTFIDDVRYLLRDPLGTWPGITSNFSLYDLGFQSERERLGGPVDLSDDLILEVESPVNVLLKGRVYDVYTGTNWEIGMPDGDFRLDSILWRRFRREALGQDRPMGGNRTERVYREISGEINVSVTYMVSSYHTLFTAGRIRNLEFSRRLIDPAGFFNMRSEVYMHHRMPARHGIEFNTRIWDTSHADFTDLFLELESIATDENDRRYDAIFERFTALPDDLPEYIHDTAVMITSNDETPYGKVMSIVNWLAHNFEYSLEPETVPENIDFVDFFLQTRVGYCTYFATTLAVMARCVDIPSRYVTGFALEAAESGSRFKATGETAHAWTELYFKGIGWVEVDPLRWNPDVPLNRGASIEHGYETPQISPPIPDLPHDIPGDIAPPIDLIEVGDIESSYWYLITIPVILIIIIILPGRIIHYLLSRKSRQFALHKVCIRKNNPYSRLAIYYKDILKQLKLLNIYPYPAETLITFPARVDKRINCGGTLFSPIAGSISAYRFAGIEPQTEQIREAYEYHRSMEKYLLETLGKWVYLFKRAIR